MGVTGDKISELAANGISTIAPRRRHAENRRMWVRGGSGKTRCGGTRRG